MGKSRIVPLGIIGLLAILIIIILAGIYFIYPKFSPVQYRAEFMDAVIVPQKDGSRKVWVVMDNSNKIPIKQKTSGNYSNTTGYECKNCETLTYIYDSQTGKVLNKIKTDLPAAINQLFLVYSKGKVWLISPGFYDAQPRIETYDPGTGKLIMDTKEFTSKYTALSPGLMGIVFNENEKTITFRTKDRNDKIIFNIESEKMYNTLSEFAGDRVSGIDKNYIEVLSPENYSAPDRMKLVRISGSKEFLASNYVNIQHSASNELLKMSSDSTKAEILSDKVYTEGIICSKDSECVLILHKEQLDKESKRTLTCVDAKTGNEKWSVPQDKMIEILKAAPGKSFTNDRLFTNGYVKALHSGNIVIYSIKDLGLAEFDFETGKSNWSIAF